MTPGRGSDVTATSAAGWSRRPGPAMRPVSVASLLLRAATATTEEVATVEVELRITMMVMATEVDFTAVLQSPNTSETPDICSASDLCPFFSCLLYLPLQQPGLPAAGEIIPPARTADFSCWSSCFAVFVLNTVKTP